MRILIFGNSGSGKSTLARQLSQKHKLPHLDLDVIVWEPNMIAVQRSPKAIAASLETFFAEHDHWIIEGCYGELVEAASSQCTKLIFLNPGLETCLEHNRQRPWEPHKYASKEAQDAMLQNLQAWAADYYERKDQWSYHAHRRIFDAFMGCKSERLDGNSNLKVEALGIVGGAITRKEYDFSKAEKNPYASQIKKKINESD